MKIFSRYDRPEGKPLTCPEASLTQQVYAQQCDINFLIKQYHLESNPYELATYVDPGKSIDFTYVDASKVPDIYSAISHFKQISQVFAAQPYDVQAKYSFSVEAFADALLKMSADELKKLDLPNLQFKKEPTPEPDQPASDGAAAPSSDSAIEDKSKASA